MRVLTILLYTSKWNSVRVQQLAEALCTRFVIFILLFIFYFFCPAPNHEWCTAAAASKCKQCSKNDVLIILHLYDYASFFSPAPSQKKTKKK